ncbi:hypothetical protein GPECTOR_61g818 [Gonium pectorale]|uniref:Uncharacterized protein n=1 Tax=Gonium pectorale TaxID=33097 RepID=A0A150G5Q2_GONPE|nr:hypothetical protein GPECTOR_61g818 [Gonium pectorale]|eukprot:KXZ44865.1 hypothetical protein GPECTOR_61g818 [Gonium pectorale]
MGQILDEEMQQEIAEMQQELQSQRKEQQSQQEELQNIKRQLKEQHLDPIAELIKDLLTRLVALFAPSAHTSLHQKQA